MTKADADPDARTARVSISVVRMERSAIREHDFNVWPRISRSLSSGRTLRGPVELTCPRTHLFSLSQN
jgi:hypothetical protein